MGIQSAIQGLTSILDRHQWIGELAGVLPLSAVIDFIETAPKIHILELVGAVPLWSWIVTPSGSRLLLGKRPIQGIQDCEQDQFGKTVSLEVLDGRYGERYFAASPETIRLTMGSIPTTLITNNHENMKDKNLRLQTIDILHITRNKFSLNANGTTSARCLRRLRHLWSIIEPVYIATVTIGWALLVSLLLMSAVFKAWISLAFCVLVPLTGTIVRTLHGGQPRRLLESKRSNYNRLLLLSEHMNSHAWIIIYGESSLVNSLVNRPLNTTGTPPSEALAAVARALLRLCVVGQWSLAIAAATTKNWNAYFISFWIMFSVLSHAYLATPTRAAGVWARQQAGLTIKKYSTCVSSRRTLLNTVVALNPDTFPRNCANVVDRGLLYQQGMKWIDAILKPSTNRSDWEEATRQAMKNSHSELCEPNLDIELHQYRRQQNNFLGPEWHEDFSLRECYWKSHIAEGIYIATKIKQIGSLPDMVAEQKQTNLE